MIRFFYYKFLKFEIALFFVDLLTLWSNKILTKCDIEILAYYFKEYEMGILLI